MEQRYANWGHEGEQVYLTLAGPRCLVCDKLVVPKPLGEAESADSVLEYTGCQCPCNDPRYGDWLRPLRAKYECALRNGFTWDRWLMTELAALFHEIDHLRARQPHNRPT
jgi:hypothetical protein